MSGYSTPPTVTIARIDVDPLSISHPIPDGVPPSWANTTGAASISKIILSGQLVGNYNWYIWDPLGAFTPEGDPEVVGEGPAESKLNPATGEHEIVLNYQVLCNADLLDGSMKIAVRIVSLDPFNEMEDLVIIPNPNSLPDPGMFDDDGYPINGAEEEEGVPYPLRSASEDVTSPPPVIQVPSAGTEPIESEPEPEEPEPPQPQGLLPEAFSPPSEDDYNVPETKEELEDPFWDWRLGTDWCGEHHVPWPWRVDFENGRWYRDPDATLPESWDPTDPTLRWTSQGWSRTHFEVGQPGATQWEGEPDRWYWDPTGCVPQDRTDSPPLIQLPDGGNHPDFNDPGSFTRPPLQRARDAITGPATPADLSWWGIRGSGAGLPSISIEGIYIDPGAQTGNVTINVELNNAHHWHYIIDQEPAVMVKAYGLDGQLCSGQENVHGEDYFEDMPDPDTPEYQEWRRNLVEKLKKAGEWDEEYDEERKKRGWLTTLEEWELNDWLDFGIDIWPEDEWPAWAADDNEQRRRITADSNRQREENEEEVGPGGPPQTPGPYELRKMGIEPTPEFEAEWEARWGPARKFTGAMNTVCSEPAPCDGTSRSVKLTVPIGGDHLARVAAVNANHQPLATAQMRFTLPVDEAPGNSVDQIGQGDTATVATDDAAVEMEEIKSLVDDVVLESGTRSDMTGAIKASQPKIQVKLQEIIKTLQTGSRSGLYTNQQQQSLVKQASDIILLSSKIFTASSTDSLYTYQEQLSRQILQLQSQTSPTGTGYEPTEDGYECPEGQVRDAATGECVPICPTGQVWNARKKRCQCSSSKEELYEGKCVRKCPPGQVRNKQTGECEDTACPPGQERIGGEGPCVPKCPSGQVRNTVTGECESPEPPEPSEPPQPPVVYTTTEAPSIAFTGYVPTPTAGISIATGGTTTYCTTNPNSGDIVMGDIQQETYTSRGTTDGTCVTTVDGIVRIAGGLTCSTGSTVTTCNGHVVVKGSDATVTTYGGDVIGNQIIGGSTTVIGGTVGTFLGVTEINGGTVKTCVGGKVTGSQPDRPCCKPTHIYTTHAKMRELWWNSPVNNWSIRSTGFADLNIPGGGAIIPPEGASEWVQALDDDGLPISIPGAGGAFLPAEGASEWVRALDDDGNLISIPGEDVIEQNTVIQIGTGDNAKCYRIKDSRFDDPNQSFEQAARIERFETSRELQWVRNHPQIRPDEAAGIGYWEPCHCCPPGPGRVKLDGNEVTLLPDPGRGVDDPGRGVDDPGRGVDDPGRGVDDPGSGVDDPGSGVDLTDVDLPDLDDLSPGPGGFWEDPRWPRGGQVDERLEDPPDDDPIPGGEPLSDRYGDPIIPDRPDGGGIWEDPRLPRGGQVPEYPDDDPGPDGGGFWPDPRIPTGGKIPTIPDGDNGWCCFIAGTQISMADGSYKNIEDIKPGDEVKTHTGINTVTEISRPLLGNRKLHDVNNTGEYFATEDHLFMTTDGWKCLNVELQQTNDLLPLTASQLDTTATIITETGSVEVDSLDVCPINDPNTQLYDLTVNEDNTYFANGFLVHNHWAPFCHLHIIPNGDDDPFITFTGITPHVTLTAEYIPQDPDPNCVLPPDPIPGVTTITFEGQPTINIVPGTPATTVFTPTTPTTPTTPLTTEPPPRTTHTLPDIIVHEDICDTECDKDDLGY